MGFQERNRFAGDVIPTEEVNRLSERSLLSARPQSGRWRPNFLLLSGVAACAYLAVGFALTTEVPIGQFIASQLDRLDRETPEVSTPSHPAEDDPLGVSSLEVAADIRFLLADGEREAAPQVRSSPPAQAMLLSSIPILPAAAVRTEPTVEATTAPVPMPPQMEVAVPPKTTQDFEPPKRPAFIDRFVTTSSPMLAAQTAPDASMLSDVAPGPAPELLWPANLSLASNRLIKSEALLTTVNDMKPLKSLVYSKFARAEVLRPTHFSEWAVPSSQFGSDNVTFFLIPAVTSGREGRGCSPVNCLPGIPLSLQVAPADRRGDTTELGIKSQLKLGTTAAPTKESTSISTSVRTESYSAAAPTIGGAAEKKGKASMGSSTRDSAPGKQGANDKGMSKGRGSDGGQGASSSKGNKGAGSESGKGNGGDKGKGDSGAGQGKGSGNGGNGNSGSGGGKESGKGNGGGGGKGGGRNK